MLEVNSEDCMGQINTTRHRSIYNASFGMVTRSLLLCSIEGVRAGIPAMTTALIAFFMRQDSNLPVFSARLPEVKKVSETTRNIDG